MGGSPSVIEMALTSGLCSFLCRVHVDPNFISCIVIIIIKLRDSFRDKLTNLFLILARDPFLKSWFLF